MSGLSRASLKRKKKQQRESNGGSIVDEEIENKELISNKKENNEKKEKKTKVEKHFNKKKEDSDDEFEGENIDIYNDEVEEVEMDEGIVMEFEPLNGNVSFDSISQYLTFSENDNCHVQELATSILQYIVQSTSIDEFYKSYWMRSIHHCNRNDKKYFKGLFSKKSFGNLVQNNMLFLNKDIVISSGSNDEENEENEENEKSIPARDIWKEFQNGFQIQLICPQVYDDKIWKLLSLLELEFESVVGCQINLLPLNGKGFGKRQAFGDFFILQVEGDSQWTVEGDSTSSEGQENNLSSSSSSESEVSSNSSVEVLLKQGDSLYIPKGFLYEEKASVSASDSSLYLLIYTNESDSQRLLFELLLPAALSQISSLRPEQRKEQKSKKDKSDKHDKNGKNGKDEEEFEEVGLGRCLPRDHWSFLGVAHSEETASVSRTRFRRSVRASLARASEACEQLLDVAVDRLKRQFVLDRLPAPLSRTQRMFSAPALPPEALSLHSVLRVVRPKIALPVVEDGKILLYHCLDNSRSLYSSEVSPLEFELDDGPAIEALLGSYAQPVCVMALPHCAEDAQEGLEVARALFREGLLVAEDIPTRALARNNEGDSDNEESDNDIF